LIEAGILLLEPSFMRFLLGGEKIIEMESINWNDNGGKN
jgi:hypothetical protein